MLGAVVLLVAWLSLAGVRLWQARRDAADGIARLEALKASMTPAKLIRGEGLSSLRAAEHDFARASSRVRSPLVAPLRVLPVIGRQVRSVDALTRSADEVVAAGTAAVQQARREIHGRQSSGSGRVEIAGRLEAIATRTDDRLAKVDLGPGEALVGPLASARDRFARELDKLRDGLRKTETASKGMEDFLRGPSHYLVMAANNSEMRAGSGMFLSAGELTVTNGEFSIDEMGTTTTLQLPAGAVTIDDADLGARWGWLAPNQEWRNLAASPRFDATASLAARMWGAKTGHTVDGVLVLDPFALQAVLAATGPVDIDGDRIDASNVVDEVLHRQYRDIPPEATADQAQRRERLSAIASAALEGLDRSGWDVATMVEQLKHAAEGRHLLAWSSRPAQQRAWRAAGVDGTLRDDSLLLAMLSQGGNKLDQFLHLDAQLAVTTTGPERSVRVTVEVRNETPPDEPRYVAGPTGQLDEGVYAGIVSLDVPGAARDLRIAGSPALVAAGSDGATRVIATRMQVARDETKRIVFSFRLPGGRGGLQVEPSARTPAVTWEFRSQAWADERSRRIRW